MEGNGKHSPLDPLGPGVNFPREYITWGGSTYAGILLGQLVQWMRERNEKEIAVTNNEWWEALRFGRARQQTARKKLRAAGLITETKKGVPPKIHFKLGKTFRRKNKALDVQRGVFN